MSEPEVRTGVGVDGDTRGSPIPVVSSSPATTREESPSSLSQHGSRPGLGVPSVSIMESSASYVPLVPKKFAITVIRASVLGVAKPDAFTTVDIIDARTGHSLFIPAGFSSPPSSPQPHLLPKTQVVKGVKPVWNKEVIIPLPQQVNESFFASGHHSLNSVHSSSLASLKSRSPDKRTTVKTPKTGIFLQFTVNDEAVVGAPTFLGKAEIHMPDLDTLSSFVFRNVERTIKLQPNKDPDKIQQYHDNNRSLGSITVRCRGEADSGWWSALCRRSFVREKAERDRKRLQLAYVDVTILEGRGLRLAEARAMKPIVRLLAQGLATHEPSHDSEADLPNSHTPIEFVTPLAGPKTGIADVVWGQTFRIHLNQATLEAAQSPKKGAKPSLTLQLFICERNLSDRISFGYSEQKLSLNTLFKGVGEARMVPTHLGPRPDNTEDIMLYKKHREKIGQVLVSFRSAAKWVDDAVPNQSIAGNPTPAPAPPAPLTPHGSASLGLNPIEETEGGVADPPTSPDPFDAKDADSEGDDEDDKNGAETPPYDPDARLDTLPTGVEGAKMITALLKEEGVGEDKFAVPLEENEEAHLSVSVRSEVSVGSGVGEGEGGAPQQQPIQQQQQPRSRRRGSRLSSRGSSFRGNSLSNHTTPPPRLRSSPIGSRQNSVSPSPSSSPSNSNSSPPRIAQQLSSRRRRGSTFVRSGAPHNTPANEELQERLFSTLANRDDSNEKPAGQNEVEEEEGVNATTSGYEERSTSWRSEVTREASPQGTPEVVARHLQEREERRIKREKRRQMDRDLVEEVAGLSRALQSQRDTQGAMMAMMAVATQRGGGSVPPSVPSVPPAATPVLGGMGQRITPQLGVATPPQSYGGGRVHTDEATGLQYVFNPVSAQSEWLRTPSPGGSGGRGGGGGSGRGMIPTPTPVSVAATPPRYTPQMHRTPSSAYSRHTPSMSALV